MPYKDSEKRRECSRKSAKKKRNERRTDRVCQQCGKIINGKSVKYCSKECKDDRDFTKRRGPVKKFVCEAENCNNIFYSRGLLKRFCSEFCNKSQASKQKRKRLKKELFEIYGNICVCCGESHEEFLTLEHKMGNGSEHRKANKDAWTEAINAADHNQYEILCMNCNWSKGKFGYCPHQLDKEV